MTLCKFLLWEQYKEKVSSDLPREDEQKLNAGFTCASSAHCDPESNEAKWASLWLGALLGHTDEDILNPLSKFSMNFLKMNF